MLGGRWRGSGRLLSCGREGISYTRAGKRDVMEGKGF